LLDEQDFHHGLNPFPRGLERAAVNRKTRIGVGSGSYQKRNYRRVAAGRCQVQRRDAVDVACIDVGAVQY